MTTSRWPPLPMTTARRNRASRASDRFARRLRAGLGPTGEMLADDFVWSTAHPDGEATEGGGDAFLTDAGGRYRPSADLQLWPIAIRDDRVMLTNEFDGAAADPTRLTLLAIDDHDRLARVSQFDPDALDIAITELERTWWATLSTDEQSTVRVSGHLG